MQGSWDWWVVETDSLVFEVPEVVANVVVCSPTKRSKVRVVTRSYMYSINPTSSSPAFLSWIMKECVKLDL